MIVETFEDLKRGIIESGTRNTSLTVKGRIVWPTDKTIYGPKSLHTLALEPYSEGDGFDFQALWDGDWSKPRWARQGIVVRNARFTCNELWMGNFHRHGQPLVFHLEYCRIATIADCRFENIGNVVYPPRTWPLEYAPTDTIITGGAIAGGVNTSLVVIRCHFENIGHGNDLNHAIYTHGGHVRFAQNTLIDCSNPLAFAGHMGGAEIDGNFFLKTETPSATWKGGARFMQPWVCYYPAFSATVFKKNVVQGTYRAIFCSHREPAEGSIIDENDYQGVVPSTRRDDNTCFWINLGQGRYVPKEEWIGLGFDGHSLWR